MSLLDVLNGGSNPSIGLGGGQKKKKTVFDFGPNQPAPTPQSWAPEGGGSDPARNSRERGAPERFDLNNFVTNPSDTDAGIANFMAAVGETPGFVYERPLAIASTLTGSPVIDESGKSFIGDIPILGDLVGGLGDAITNIQMAPSALANMNVIKGLADGYSSGWTDDTLMPGKYALTYAGQEKMTWAEYKKRAAGQGFTSQDVEDFIDGKKQLWDFGEKAVSDNMAFNLAYMIATDPFNLVFAAGPVMKLASGVGLLGKMVESGAISSKALSVTEAAVQVGIGKADTTWLGMAKYFEQAGRGMAAFPGGSAAVSLAGTAARGTLKGAKIYQGAALGATAAQAGLLVTGNALKGTPLSGFLEPLFEVNQAAFDNRPLSRNMAFAIFSAVNFPVHRWAGKVRDTWRTTRYDGVAVQNKLLDSLAEGWGATRDQVIGRFGGIDEFDNFLYHIAANIAFDKIYANPKLRAALSHYDSLQEAALKNNYLADLIKANVAEMFAKRKIGARELDQRMRDWFANREGINNRVEFPWNGRDVIDRWHEYGQVAAPVSDIFYRQATAIIGLADHVPVEGLTGMQAAIRAAATDGKVGIDVLRSWLSRYPQLVKKGEGPWVQYLLKDWDGKSVPLAEIDKHLRRDIKNAPSVREMTAEFAAREKGANREWKTMNQEVNPDLVPESSTMRFAVSRMRPQIAKRLGLRDESLPDVLRSRNDPDILAFEEGIGLELVDAGFDVDHVTNSVGAWEGSLEPSIEVAVNGSSLYELRLAAATAGKAGGQDAVAISVAGSKLRQIGVAPNGFEVVLKLPDADPRFLQRVADIIGTAFEGFTVNDTTGLVRILVKDADLDDALNANLARITSEIEALFPSGGILGESSVTRSVHPAYIELVGSKSYVDVKYTEILKDARRNGDARAGAGAAIGRKLADSGRDARHAASGLGSNQAVERLAGIDGGQPGGAALAEALDPSKATTSAEYAYHATPVGNLVAIAEDRLRPQHPLNPGAPTGRSTAWDNGGAGKRIYFDADPTKAALSVTQPRGLTLADGQVAVMRVHRGRLRNLKGEHTGLDGDPFYVNHAIAPKDVEVWVGGQWVRLERILKDDVPAEAVARAAEVEPAVARVVKGEDAPGTLMWDEGRPDIVKTADGEVWFAYRSRPGETPRLTRVTQPKLLDDGQYIDELGKKVSRFGPDRVEQATQAVAEAQETYNAWVGRAREVSGTALEAGDGGFTYAVEASLAVPRRGDPVDGYTIKVASGADLDVKDPGHGWSPGAWSEDWTVVRVLDAEGNSIGEAFAHPDAKHGGFSVDHVWVDEAHRRKGIANWMHAEIERQTGKTLVPSSKLLEDGQAHWAQPDRPFGNETPAINPMTRPQLESDLQAAFNLTAEQASDMADIWDAYARSWASRTGRAVEEFWDTRLAGIVYGGEAGSLLQIQATARRLDGLQGPALRSAIDNAPEPKVLAENGMGGSSPLEWVADEAGHNADGMIGIPGGLKGLDDGSTWSLWDVWKLQSQGLNPAVMEPGLRTKIYNKLFRTMERGNTDPLDVYNRQIFAVMSPQNNLTQNQAAVAALRVRDMAELQQYADIARTVRESRAFANNRDLATAIGEEIAKTRPEYKAGVMITRDKLGAIALNAEKFIENPDWFTLKAGETHVQFAERLSSVLMGVQLKVGNFSLMLGMPESWGLGTMDFQMVKLADRAGLLPPEVRARLATENTKGGTTYIAPKTEPMDYRITAPRTAAKLGINPGDLNPELPPHLRNLPWDPPSNKVTIFSGDYRVVAEATEAMAKRDGMPFAGGGNQWVTWDSGRSRFEAHMAAFPGAYKLPRMEYAALVDAREAHKAVGYMLREDPKTLQTPPVGGMAPDEAFFYQRDPVVSQLRRKVDDLKQQKSWAERDAQRFAEAAERVKDTEPAQAAEWLKEAQGHQSRADRFGRDIDDYNSRILAATDTYLQRNPVNEARSRRAYGITRSHGNIKNWANAMWREQEAAEIADFLALADADHAAAGKALASEIDAAKAVGDAEAVANLERQLEVFYQADTVKSAMPSDAMPTYDALRHDYETAVREASYLRSDIKRFVESGVEPPETLLADAARRDGRVAAAKKELSTFVDSFNQLPDQRVRKGAFPELKHSDPPPGVDANNPVLRADDILPEEADAYRAYRAASADDLCTSIGFSGFVGEFVACQKGRGHSGTHLWHHSPKSPVKAERWTGSATWDQYRDFMAERGIQLQETGVKGSTSFVEGGKALVRGFKAADFSTGVHELGHVILPDLIDDVVDGATTRAWLGVKEGQALTRRAHEKFARGLERYLRDGKAPTPELEGVFARARGWMVDIYRRLRGSAIDVRISPEMRDVFERLFQEVDPEAYRTAGIAEPRSGTLATAMRVAEDGRRWVLPDAEAAQTRSRIADLGRKKSLNEAESAEFAQLTEKIDKHTLASGEAKKAQVLYLAEMDAKIGRQIPLHRSLDATPAEAKVALETLNARIRRDYPTYELKHQPKMAQFYTTDGKDLVRGYLEARGLVGDVVARWGALGRVSRFLDWLTAPVTNARLGNASRQSLYNLMLSRGAKVSEVDAFIKALAEESKLHTIGPMEVRAFRNGTSLTAQSINKIAAGDPLSGRAPIFNKNAIETIGRDNFAKLIDQASNRFVRWAQDTRVKPGKPGAFAAAVDDAYQGFQKTKAGDVSRLVSKTMYHWLRFISDPRWWAMNVLEADMLGGLRYGVGATRLKGAQRAQPGREFLAHEMGHEGARMAKVTEQALSDAQNGWLYTRRLGGYASRAFDHERPQSVIDFLRMVEGDDVYQGLQDLARRATDVRSTDAMFLEDIVDGLDKYLYDFDTKGTVKTINDEAKRIFDDQVLFEGDPTRGIPPMAPVLQKIWEANDGVWQDIQKVFHGNPNRSTLERLGNSYWLYWPLSYQIKAGKWLWDVMTNKFGGVRTGMTTAAMWNHYFQKHKEAMARDAEYSAMFEEHPSAWFVAQMLFPITPVDVGVSLSRPLRFAGGKLGVWGDYKSASDPVTAAGAILSFGPTYTAELMARLGRELFKGTTENMFPSSGQSVFEARPQSNFVSAP